MKMNKKMKIEDLKIQSFVTSINHEDSNTVLGGKLNITERPGCLPTDICNTLGKNCTVAGLCQTTFLA